LTWRVARGVKLQQSLALGPITTREFYSSPTSSGRLSGAASSSPLARRASSRTGGARVTRFAHLLF